MQMQKKCVHQCNSPLRLWRHAYALVDRQVKLCGGSFVLFRVRDDYEKK